MLVGCLGSPSDCKKTAQNSRPSSRRKASILFFRKCCVGALLWYLDGTGHLHVALPCGKYHDSGLALGGREAVAQTNLRNSTFLRGTTAVVRGFPSAHHAVSTPSAVRHVCQRVASPFLGAGVLRFRHCMLSLQEQLGVTSSLWQMTDCWFRNSADGPCCISFF